jgi:Rieske Fe-S protein
MAASELSRRSVLNGCALSAVAGVAGFAVAKGSAAAKPKSPTEVANAYGTVQAGGQLLAKVDQVPAGGGIIIASAKVVLTKDSAGAVHGFSAVCTHQGCTVGSVEGGTINCPCHGSQFDVKTGAVVTGPAKAPLAAVPVVVKGASVYAG